MDIFLFWFGLSFVVAGYANGKGLNPFGFFFASILLSPLIGFGIALGSKGNK